MAVPKVTRALADQLGFDAKTPIADIQSAWDKADQIRSKLKKRPVKKAK